MPSIRFPLEPAAGPSEPIAGVADPVTRSRLLCVPDGALPSGAGLHVDREHERAFHPSAVPVVARGGSRGPAHAVLATRGLEPPRSPDAWKAP
ncbi:MAG: hypothetical protein A2V77_07405 [Anaeromyxobacter sp. RBG_16_69_14]|nr:MAG: hypothetical protein A2V77_07405 [Anaeromyxobacter sp. RBG_16_69_14]